MMSGAYVLTDTIDKAFDSIFVDSYAGTDAVVTGKDPASASRASRHRRPRSRKETLETVRGVDGVEIATGTVQDFQTKLLRPDGEAIDTGGAPSFAFGIETAPEFDRFNPLNLVEGRWPSGGSEVAIDEGVAGDEDPRGRRPDRRRRARAGAGVHDRRDRQVRRPELDRRSDVRDLRRADRPDPAGQGGQARRDLGRGGRRHDARGADAADPVRARRGGHRAHGVEQATEESSEIATFTTIIRYFLLSFAGIALFVGAFVIFNTLSITVAQRTREFATLRTLGASRRQVLRSVILEALVIGLGASIIGLFAGLGLAVGLNELFKALNLDLPQTETVFATRTIVVSLLVGTLVTLVAGLFPAIRATRVPPIAAVREGATLPRGASRASRRTSRPSSSRSRCSHSPTGRSPTTSPRATASCPLGVDVLALFIGVAMLSSRLVRPLGRPHLVGHWLTVVVMVLLWPFFTLPYWLLGAVRSAPAAHSNASARSCSALSPVPAADRGWRAVTKWQPEWPMEFPGVARRVNRIGRDRARPGDRRRADDRDRARDVHLRARQRPARLEQRRDRAPDPVRPDHHLAGRLLRVPGCGRRRGRGRRRRRDRQQRPAGHRADRRATAPNLTGLDDKVAEVYDFRWEEGSDAVLTQLGSDGALLPGNVAEDRDLAVGDTFTVRSTGNETRTSSSAASTRAARSTRCSDRRASRRRRSTSSTSARATASRSSTSPTAAPRRRAGTSRARSRPSRTRASRRARSGSTRRIRRSSSSCSCSTSCSRSP